MSTVTMSPAVVPNWQSEIPRNGQFVVEVFQPFNAVAVYCGFSTIPDAVALCREQAAKIADTYGAGVEECHYTGGREEGSALAVWFVQVPGMCATGSVALYSPLPA